MNFSISMELQRAWRRLLRAPAFSLSVIVLIAFSIGGVAAVATAGWSLFAKPLPYSQADQLVTVSVWRPGLEYHFGLSPALVAQLNREGRFGSFGIVERPFEVRMHDGAAIRGGRIDHRVLSILRISPIAGRIFDERDVEPGAAPAALISERVWRGMFGSDPEVVDRVVDIEGGSVRIVGILPDTMAIPEAMTDIWLPVELGPDRLSADTYRHLLSHTVVGRIGDDGSLEVYGDRLTARLNSDEQLNWQSRDDIEVKVRPLRELWSFGSAEGLVILGSATAVVLLGAWLNLAGLWLARWTRRSRELAIQFALGSPRGLAALGALLEYALLGVPGLALAMVVSGTGLELLYALGVLDDDGPLRATLAAPTIVLGLVVLGLGMVPVIGGIAWTRRRLGRSGSGDLAGKGTGARSGASDMQRLLMAGQIGIAFSLLIALAMLFTSWTKLLNEDLGFDSDRLVTAMTAAPPDPLPGPDTRVASAVERLRGLPGVDRVSWSNAVPFGGLEFVSGVVLDSDRLEAGVTEPVEARSRFAGPDFFQTAGIKVLSGRSFGPEDAGAATVIVDESFERRYLDGAGLGRRVGYPDADLTVVGIVESVRHEAPDEQAGTPTIYRYAHLPAPQTQLLVRTGMNPESLIADVRQTLEQQLGADRIYSVVTLGRKVRGSVSDREPQLILIAIFTGLALVLVFYGLYALQSYRVAIVTAEIGLRRAIGASRTKIIAAEMMRALRLLPGGLLLGLPGAWLAGKVIDNRLYNVGATDPGLWLVTATAIAATILLASVGPALHASRIQPLEALRYE